MFFINQGDIEKANEIHLKGKTLIEDNHYAVDSISPKCLELEKMVGDFQHQLQRKLDILRKYCDLHEKIEKVFPYYCLTLMEIKLKLHHLYKIKHDKYLF